MGFFSDISALFKTKKDDYCETKVLTDFNGPFKLRKDSFVEFDNVPFNMLEEMTNFGTVPENQKIASIGKVDLGQGSHLFRYYFDDDETWMQLNLQGDVLNEDSVEEMILWKYHHTETPSSFNQVNSCLSKIGQEQITLDGKTYDRVWGCGEKTDLIEFNEEVYIDKDDIKDYTVRHKCMLYRRTLKESTRIEFYLISAENGGDGTMIVHSIGLSMSPEDIKNF